MTPKITTKSLIMRHNAEQEAPWRLPVSVLMAGEGRGGGGGKGWGWEEDFQSNSKTW